MDQTWRYIRGLKSPDWRIRRISCVQLGERRGTAVVEALIEALDDSREEVSLAAGEALAKIGDPAAIDALARHCSNLERHSGRTYESYRAA
jgi:HEAT repeat protein